MIRPQAHPALLAELAAQTPPRQVFDFLGDPLMALLRTALVSKAPEFFKSA